MKIFNLMTCENLGTSILGGCAMGWLSIAIVFFLALVLRRQTDDGILAGTGFNFIAALVVGLGATIVMITLTGSARWALVLGVAGLAVGGFGIGLLTGGSEYG